MFNEEFYPTPIDIARKMWLKVNPHRKTVLDPSCGKGDLICHLNGYVRLPVDPDEPDSYLSYVTAEKLLGIEIEPELQAISRDKGISIIGFDFFQTKIDDVIDIIYMNPPFSNADKHFLHAWEIISDGGRIVCLMNEETVKNPYSKDRQAVVELISKYGEVEYLGEAFKNAERPTNVRVAMVTVTKPENNEKFYFREEGRSFQEEKKINFHSDELVASEGIVKSDFIQAIVNAYEESKTSFVDLIKAKNKAVSLIDTFTTNYNSVDLKECLFKSGDDKSSNAVFLAKLKRQAWKYIIDKTKIRDIATSKLREDFDKFLNEQAHMAFTKENILALIEMFMQNAHVYIYKAVLDVFEKMCSYDKENKVHWEGWKTNDAYKVNYKVIMPYFVTFDERFMKKFETYIKSSSFLYDIDIAMCHVSGRKINEVIQLGDALQRQLKVANEHIARGDYDPKEHTVGHSTFFEFKFHKKGTLHLWFKEEEVWTRFNIYAAAGKQWLPPNDIKAREAEEKLSNKKKKIADAYWEKVKKQKNNTINIRAKTELTFTNPNARGKALIDIILSKFGNCNIIDGALRFMHISNNNKEHFELYDNFSEVIIKHCNENWESIQTAAKIGYFNEKGKILTPAELFQNLYKELIEYDFIIENIIDLKTTQQTLFDNTTIS